MKIFYEHNTRPRAAGPKDESARKRIPYQPRNTITQHLQHFKSDTSTRNQISPGDGCRMEVSTPPPMRDEYTGKHSNISLGMPISIPVSAIEQSKHLPTGKNFDRSGSGEAGGKVKVRGNHAASFTAKLETDRDFSRSGKSVYAVIKENQRNMDVTLESKGKGKTSITGVKCTRCPGHHLVYQHTTLAESSALIPTKNTDHERGNPYVALAVFHIGQRASLNCMPTWSPTAPVWERWLNKQMFEKPAMGDQRYAHFG